MIDSSYNNLKSFISTIEQKETKKSLIGFLNKIAGINLYDICFDNIEILQSIAEYEFYLVDLIGVDYSNEKKDIFLKIIKKGKIKESLFCICDLLYEKYLRKTEKDNELKQQKKITILEEKERYQKLKKVSVNFIKNSIDKRNTKVEIYFVDIEKIIEKNKNKKGWEKYLETNRKNILILGIIKNN